MTVQTDSVLALYRFYVNASDYELKELEVDRPMVLDLIRQLEGDDEGYRQTELNTIARQMLKAFVAGKAL